MSFKNQYKMAISEHLTYARCYTKYFISIDSSEQSCEVPLLSHFTNGEIEAQQYLPKVTQSETEEAGIQSGSVSKPGPPPHSTLALPCLVSSDHGVPEAVLQLPALLPNFAMTLGKSFPSLSHSSLICKMSCCKASRENVKSSQHCRWYMKDDHDNN